MIWGLGWFLCGLIAMGIGQKKGEGFLGLFVGWLFGPFGILIALTSTGNRAPCPFCKEYIHKNAVICPHCRQDLSTETETLTTSSHPKGKGVEIGFLAMFIFLIVIAVEAARPGDSSERISQPQKDPSQTDDGIPITECDIQAASDLNPDQNPHGVPFDKINPVLAIPACEDAVRKYPSSDRLTFELGRSYSKKGDFNSALIYFHKAADHNYPPAQNSIGTLYATGEGVSKDEAAAINWYLKAADQNYVGGEVNLGLAYENGRGVPKDYAEALKWYRKAADQGSAAAQDSIGYFYTHGMGIEKDAAQAAFWYRKEAEQGVATGQFNLGLMYEDGVGVPADRAMAIDLYKKAADQGNVQAEQRLAKLQGVEADSQASPSALEIPSFDVDAYCARYLAASNTGDRDSKVMAKNLCVHQEQSNYDYLKSIWSETPEKIKTDCLNLHINPAFGPVPVYSLLADCIGPRLAVERETREQSFHP